MNRICARCGRVVDMNDLNVNEGRPYHDHCLLQVTRTRIAFLSDKMGRRTATVLDADELKDLLFIEERMKKDIETSPERKLTNNDKPIFFGNTPFGKHSIMNSPTWKKILAKNGSLEGTKFHMHKVAEHQVPTTEPIWQITTDETGHKGVIQVGSKPKKIDIPMDPKKVLITGHDQTDLIISQKQTPVDYERGRIEIDVWRGFELLDKLIPNSNILDLNARVAAMNRERNQQNVLAVAI